MTREPLRDLPLYDTTDIFVAGGIKGRVRITRTAPVTGELIRDSASFYFLTPEEDLRGGGSRGAVRLHELPALAKRYLVGQLVKVAGIYEEAAGLQVEAIAAEEQPFEE